MTYCQLTYKDNRGVAVSDFVSMASGNFSGNFTFAKVYGAGKDFAHSIKLKYVGIFGMGTYGGYSLAKPVGQISRTKPFAICLGQSEGHLTLGLPDTAYYTGPFTEPISVIPGLTPSAWAFNLSSLSIAGVFPKLNNASKLVELDSTSNTLLEPSLYDAVLSTLKAVGLNADFFDQGKDYCAIVASDTVSRYPSIVFNFQSGNQTIGINFASQFYLKNYKNEEGDDCVTFNFNRNTPNSNKTTLGLNFLGQYYTVFNSEMKTVAFAIASVNCDPYSSVGAPPFSADDWALNFIVLGLYLDLCLYH